ncbi:hypothetical protein B0A52_09635 [Exophiala mesophila]|uniref:DAGKc domain-containing protein n=1 Tax=Exophiala mesophila TaxID=212818 RepID=A0A438MTM0_EXOME|nr:hypothetical protein B0A52_09635 [Exophiala mesophila]
MASGRSIDSDPFADPISMQDERATIVESTLSVGRNATLTLGTDAVIVLDEGIHDTAARQFSCCGLIPERTTSTRSIPYFNILWAELVKNDLTVRYAQPTSKSPKAPLRVAYINYTLDDSSFSQDKATRWVKRLLDRAYGAAQRNKRIKLLINPFGGQGKAEKLYSKWTEPIFAAARCEVDVERTTYSGHAVEIAQNIDINAFDVLVSASGDGLPHECFNGLAKKPNAAEALRKVAIAQLPCGSGNAMCWNLNGTGECSMAALCIVKGVRTPMDLVSVTQGDKRTLSFLSQSLGIVAESDLGTDNVRWMGESRFVYGFLVRLLGKTVYPIDIAVKTEIEDKLDIKRHYARYRNKATTPNSINLADLDGPLDASTGLGLPPLEHGTINDPLPTDSGWSALTPYDNMGNFYCGNMNIMSADTPFFPASVPSDGLCDLITIDGDISRLTSLNLLLAVEKGTFFDKDVVRIRKIKALRVYPRYGRHGVAPPKQTHLGKLIDKLGLSGSGSTEKAVRGDGGFFSVDGEKLPFEPFQLECHKGLGTVLSRHCGLYQADGPAGWDSLSVSNDDNSQQEEGDSL